MFRGKSALKDWRGYKNSFFNHSTYRIQSVVTAQALHEVQICGIAEPDGLIAFWSSPCLDLPAIALIALKLFENYRRLESL